jgi:hypothetical protein
LAFGDSSGTLIAMQRLHQSGRFVLAVCGECCSQHITAPICGVCS